MTWTPRELHPYRTVSLFGHSRPTTCKSFTGGPPEPLSQTWARPPEIASRHSGAGQIATRKSYARELAENGAPVPCCSLPVLPLRGYGSRPCCGIAKRDRGMLRSTDYVWGRSADYAQPFLVASTQHRSSWSRGRPRRSVTTSWCASSLGQ